MHYYMKWGACTRTPAAPCMMSGRRRGAQELQLPAVADRLRQLIDARVRHVAAHRIKANAKDTCARTN